jgi:hypothetical protein
MSNVITLHADDELIKKLEDWLALAKSGALKSFAGVFVHDSIEFDSHTPNQCEFQLIGNIEYIKAGLLSEINDDE